MKKIFILLILLVLFLSACTKANLDSGTNSQSTSGESEMNEINSTYSSSSKQEISQKDKEEETKANKEELDDNKNVSVEYKELSDEEKEILLGEKETSKQEISKVDKELLLKVSDKKKSELITEIHNEEDIFSKISLYRLYEPGYGFNPTLEMFDQYIGLKIECLRRVDDQNYYCVYKTKENGYWYCFFRNTYSQFTLYNTCYLKETLTKADFKNLKLGDSIESVTKIDSAFLAIYNFHTKEESALPYSVHLLKDGLLIIEYENNNIKKIDFNADFTYSKNVIKYNYKILKDDYPQ
ncbi:MAG: hypothetical protein IJN03_03135 [Bacilli bacterium]|nr:hypothetical protein [Bacilli bacterium]